MNSFTHTSNSSTQGVISEYLYLYRHAAPVWSRCLRFKTYRNLLIKKQRKGSLRIACAYRTVSSEAAAVISRTIPMDLMVEERCATFGKNKSEKREEKERTIEKWQHAWSGGTNGAWTRELIPDLRPWYERAHGQIGFHLTQVISGHGCFEAYIHRIGKTAVPYCYHCHGMVDTAEHTVFHCRGFQREREELNHSVGVTVTKDNMVSLMLMSKERWELIEKFVGKIMSRKEEFQRGIQLGNQN
jgi:hypothetical protein